MLKKKIIHVCQNCGAVYGKWLGKCEACQGWNTITEERVESSSLSKKALKLNHNDIIEIHELQQHGQETIKRYDVGIGEVNRVLGGGLVKGSAILIAGEPGIGKSTLLLQLSVIMANNNFTSLYVSGEESIEQIRMRAMRLGLNNSKTQVATTTSLSEIIAILEKLESPAVIIIDSIQTLYHEAIESAPGTVNQVRNCSFELIKASKKSGVTLILVGHVTKEGQIAGPKVLEHMVDTVIYFEGESSQQFRILRAIKNRYGPTNEIGIFEMASNGLQEVNNPSSIFMPTHELNVSGSCIFAGLEGTRPILVEIQALVAPSFLASPRRAAIGWDSNRLAMMIAILNTRFGINLSNKEVYLNVVGGLKITEPAADLAVIMALISSIKNIPLDHNTVFFGEVGLSGELRQVAHYESRLNEAVKLGLEKAVMPFERKNNSCNIEQISVKHVLELKQLFNNKGI